MAFIFFDLSDKNSFSELKFWLEELNKNGNTSVLKVLVGTKADLDNKRKVKFDEVNAFAKTNNMRYFKGPTKNDLSSEKIVGNLLNYI